MKNDQNNNGADVTNLQDWKDSKESHNMHDAAFGERLQRYISEAELTPVKLATIIGIESAEIDRYVQGQIPSSSVLLKIARALEVSMEELLTGKANTREITAETLRHFAKELRARRRAEKLNRQIDQNWIDNVKWYIASAIVSFFFFCGILYSNLPVIMKFLLGNVLCYGVFMMSLALIAARRIWIAKIVRNVKWLLYF